MDSTRRIAAWALGLLLLVGVEEASSAEDTSPAALIGYEANFESPAKLLAIDPATGAPSTPAPYADCFADAVLFFESGNGPFVSGLAAVGEVVYGLEWESDPDIHLFRVSKNQFGCAEGARVGASPVGEPGLESLAYCEADGFLYTATFVSTSAPHRGRLMRIDAVSGAGVFVDPGVFLPNDFNVTGMACDDQGVLHAVTAGFGGVGSRYLTIDRLTGVGTSVGPTNGSTGDIQALSANPVSGELFAGGTSLYSVNRQSGAASVVNGSSFDALWGLTYPVPEPGAASLEVAVLASVAGLRNAARARRRTPGPPRPPQR